MAVCDISVLPSGYDGDAYQLVDKIIEEIKKSGLKFKVNAMSTVVEGETSKLFELALLLHKKAFEFGAKDVITMIRVHESEIYDDSIYGKTYKYEK